MIDTDRQDEDVSAAEQEAFNALMNRYFGIDQSPTHTTYSEEEKN